MRTWLPVGALTALVLGSTACGAPPPETHRLADALAAEFATLPGVQRATTDVADRVEAGDPHVWLSVDVADDATPGQVADVVGHYLSGVRAVDFSGIVTELDVHRAGDRFAVDSGSRPVTNDVQIADQVRDWLALRQALPGATVDVRATVAHADVTPDRYGHPVIGRIDLPEPAGTAEVAAAVTVLGGVDIGRTAGTWTVAGSKTHPSSVTAVGRLPSPRELETFTAVDADQSIPHVSSLYVNAPQTPPVWLSESIPSHDPADRAGLAARQLPVVAALPAPVLYTATDQAQGYRDFFGRSTGPIAVTIGGCTARTYTPTPAEQQLLARYERCPR